MTGLRIDLHPGARDDYLESLDWYLDRRVRVAQRFQEEFANSLNRIAAHPELAAADSEGIRWTKMEPFPHLVYYRLKDDKTIQVLAVAHTRRRPGYWRNRAK